ncbi:MAG: hypothetical protein OXC28_12515 [Defluviicoccus sp.]|nr:hypothetical protein [Defluviicoccus sp.]
MTTFHRFVLPAIAAALVLAACGGDRNGGSTASQQTAPSPPPPAALRAARQFHDHTAVTFHRQPGGHGAQAIVEYLRAASGGGGPAHERDDEESPTGLITFAAPPTVRLASDTPRELRALADRAVDAINRWLPYGKRLGIGADIAPLTPLDDIPRGQIALDFADPRHWRPAGSDHTGLAVTRFTNADTAPETYSARVFVAPVRRPGQITIAIHELLHALAVTGHISSDHFPTTIMAARSDTTREVLAIDGEALLAAYTRFAPGTHPDDITLDSLGPWATETMHLQGRIAAPGNAVNFGVSFRNGLARPWFRGSQPDTDIADNPALAGSVEWNGTLLGFTAEGRSAAGAARIALDLGTLDGTAEFTDIETWNGAPGAQGSGAAWRDLAYAITATGNSFRNTAGDAGELRGRFTGSRHQGAAGTLERTDLSGAFAAAR